MYVFISNYHKIWQNMTSIFVCMIELYLVELFMGWGLIVVGCGLMECGVGGVCGRGGGGSLGVRMLGGGLVMVILW